MQKTMTIHPSMRYNIADCCENKQPNPNAKERGENYEET